MTDSRAPEPRELTVVSPIDGSIYVQRAYAAPAEVGAALDRARRAQAAWKRVPLKDRAALCTRAVDAFVRRKAAIAEEITRQMGRPIRHSPGEVSGFEERARHMIAIAEEALAPVRPGPKNGFRRWISREPLGVVLVVAPWNYPLLTAVNAVVPALMAGNAVLLKHSAQTPLAAERMVQAFVEAGAPEGLFQYLHLTHETASQVIRAPEVAFVAFTGSVAGGAAVEHAAAGRFIGVGLELGGNDPAYVRHDCDIVHAAETVVDGAFYNAGQSCCGIQRIYVHEHVYDEFVERAVALVRQYRLGNPLEEGTTLGPCVRTAAADAVREAVTEAVRRGATPLIDEHDFPAARKGTPYLVPQLLANVDHGMAVMKDEVFGPVAGIMKVRFDEEAITLMNDSPYGLTAAVFTRDEDAAVSIGARIDTGTFFMNRCDYLDPALAWTGVKNTGRGCTLSTLGYEQLTRPKSFHLKTNP